MSTDRSVIDRIHSRAVEITACYRRAEAELIEILQQVEEHRVFLERGYPSLFSYVVKELWLSESTAYSLITIARKARHVPELKTRFQQGAMTLSNAKQIVALLTPGDSQRNSEWIQKASELSRNGRRIFPRIA